MYKSCTFTECCSPEERVEPAQVPYVKDPTKVMMTKNSRDAHVRVEQRTKDLIEYAENCEFNRVERGLKNTRR